MLNTPESGLHAVRNAGREFLGPLIHGLIRDADGVRRSRDRPAKEPDCIRLEHVGLNHGSRLGATIVSATVDSLAGMETYRERLAFAMKLRGVSVETLAKELELTLNGVKKALKGGQNGTSSMSAYNNSKTAAYLKVDPDWLATGEGEALTVRVWPFQKLTPEQWSTVPQPVRSASEAGLLSAIAPAAGEESKGRLLAPSDYHGVSINNKAGDDKKKAL